MKTKPKLLRITTVPISIKLLLRGQLRYMQQQGFEMLAVSADGPEVSSILQEGIRHQKIPLSRKITPFRDMVCLLKLIFIILKFRPDIVHAHTPKAGLLGMMAAWLCRVPVRMHTIAGLPITETTGFTRSVLRLTERVTYWCAHFVYPNSKGLADYIKTEFNFRHSKIKMIGHGSSNGINIEYFSTSPQLLRQAEMLRKKYSIAKDSIVYCYIGRIVSDKGINELVDAFDKLSSARAVRLFLVGHFEDDLDPVSDRSRKIINQHPDIINVGYQDDIRPFLLASNIFVLPSYREGFPNVVLQACCLKIACIVSDINGCNEIITHNSTGLLVKKKDSDDLREAMNYLADNTFLRDKFSEQANRFVVNNFDQRNIWSALLTEYKVLLDHVQGAKAGPKPT